MSFDRPIYEGSDESRRKRLRYQSWHRGTREMDLILGRFVEGHVDAFSTEEMDELERLFAVPDTALYRWICGQEATPAEYDGALLARIKSFAAGSAGP